MKFSRLLSAVIATAALVTASVAYAAPPTDVVLGNLGVSGTDSVGNFNADIGSGSVPFLLAAQGFTAASPNLTVQSVGLWLFGDGSVPASVGIYSNSSGLPGTLLYTSSTVNIGAKSLYQFSFSGANLSNGTSYWIVPQTSTEISWYVASAAPTAQNGSGYTFLGARQNIGSGWTAAGATDTFSTSISAVPEPSTYALAGIGVAAAGLMRWRRRNAGR
jgi:hypothetical protein